MSKNSENKLSEDNQNYSNTAAAAIKILVLALFIDI